MKNNHLFPFEWTLKDANFTKDKGKVFSCFACGGGSTMGYKLAGFDVIGCNEIDPRMMEAYVANHNPKFPFLEPIQSFKNKEELPEELFNLDILDGSPPCSTFSIAGNREDDWGKMKKFREGQAEQILDTLFFDFIELAARLKPKVVVAENVKGLLLGSAKEYVRKIYEDFEKAGYYCQHWLLDSSLMGIPQKRERVFFIALRKDLGEPFLEQANLFDILPKLELSFNEATIPFKNIKEKNAIGLRPELYNFHKKAYKARKPGDKDLGYVTLREEGVRKYFNTNFLYDDNVCGTITAHKDNACFLLFNDGRYLSEREFKLIGSYPLDYDFKGNNPGYLIGMSVPPLMTAQISNQIYKQWLSKL